LSSYKATAISAAATPPTTHCAFPVIIGIPPVLLLVFCAVVFALVNCVDVVTFGFALVDSANVVLEKEAVELVTFATKLVELNDALELELAEVIVAVEEAVVGVTRWPAVIVTSWPPSSDPPLVNVVCALVDAEVMVPRTALMDLLHVPWSEVMVQPTSMTPLGSSDAVAVCE